MFEIGATYSVEGKPAIYRGDIAGWLTFSDLGDPGKLYTIFRFEANTKVKPYVKATTPVAERTAPLPVTPAGI
jgi:hypothetical protein